VRQSIGNVLCAVALVLLVGCARPLRVDQPELKMMPPEVALKLVRKYIPAADDYRIPARKAAICDDKKPVWATYTEVTFASYSAKHSHMLMTNGGICFIGVLVPNLSRTDAAELAAAMNSLGAKIHQVLVV